MTGSGDSLELCGAPMRHPDGQLAHADGTPVDDRDLPVYPCTLPEGHAVQIKDSDHIDGYGCAAPARRGGA